ncbi:hypothetical protein AGMMS50230_00460 [Spirochaetia bacterium]|nr:hypothetical protein AGMMS50230_00460 [Spirochaetia bacterium]
MSKKVLLMNGSARKKNTWGILQQLVQILKNHGIEGEILNLFDYRIEDCTGCESCVSHSGCSIEDDMPVLMQKIMEADGVILSSPVYMGSVTSKFKTFADRLSRWIHKPETAGKPVMFVSTTMATGLKETRQFFEAFATGFGARKGGFISRAGKAINTPVKDKELSRFLTLLGEDTASYRPAMGEIVMFAVGKAMASKSSGDDRRFWEEKEWFNKSYYYPCKMGPGKKLFSKLMFKVISNAMR